VSSGSHELLRSANDQLRKFREGLALSPAGERGRLPTPAELQALGCLMEQVRPLLKENPDDPVIRVEIDAYTENLTQVRGLLEGLQSELTARRDDLRAEWKRLQAAAAWGGSIQQIR
jgi:hypothetical protein